MFLWISWVILVSSWGGHLELSSFFGSPHIYKQNYNLICLFNESHFRTISRIELQSRTLGQSTALNTNSNTNEGGGRHNWWFQIWKRNGYKIYDFFCFLHCSWTSFLSVFLYNNPYAISGRQLWHNCVQLLLSVGPPVPHLPGCHILHASMLLAHDGGRSHEVLWQRNYHQVISDKIYSWCDEKLH